jgi:hypothetical protein
MTTTWSTRDELSFLRNLGLHTGRDLAGGRAALLLGYRQGLGLRRVWVGIDRAVVLTAADHELSLLQSAEQARVLGQ